MSNERKRQASAEWLAKAHRDVMAAAAAIVGAVSAAHRGEKDVADAYNANAGKALQTAMRSLTYAEAVEWPDADEERCDD